MAKLGTRRLVILLSAAIFALSACESSSAPTGIERDDYVDPQVLQTAILVNTSSSRSGAKVLDSSRLRGKVYFYLSDTNNVSKVGYRFNNPSRSDSPFKVAGPTEAVAVLTTSLPNRTHLLTAEVSYKDGSTKVFSATFLVDNADNLSDQLLVSNNSYRGSSRKLDGAKISQSDYIFVVPKQSVSRIDFLIDGKSSPRQSERYAFYDMGGTTNEGRAWSINRQGSLSGQHTVTAVIYRTSGEVVRRSASFSVGSSPAPNPEPEPEPAPEPEPTPQPDANYGPVRNPSIPSGAVYISPGQDINSIINSRPEGSTFVLKAGKHRGQSIILSENSTLIGEYNAILTGAKTVSEFSQSGSQWVLSNQTQQSKPYDGSSAARRCLDGYAMCKLGEQVFIDGKSLKQVSSRDNVRSGQFYFDYGANKIYLADDPRGKFVEVSFYQSPLIAEPGSTVRNLVIEKYNTSPLKASVVARQGTTFERNTIRHNGGIGITIADNVVLKRNRILANTRLGLHGYTTSNAVIEGNEIAYNNFNGHYYDHEAGGAKFLVSDNLKIRSNYAHHNIGSGLWADGKNRDILYENNTVTDNVGNGIFHELSFSGEIRNNVVERNKNGILVTNSKNVKIHHNTLRGNTSSLVMRNSCRREVPDGHTTENIEFYSNTVYQKAHIGPNSEWTKGKAASFNAHPTCEHWSETADDWYYRRGNRFYNNTYNLSGQTSGSRYFFYWENSGQTYSEWKAFGQN